MATLNSKIILAKGINMDKDYVNVLSYSTNDILTLLNQNTHYVNSSETFSFIGGKNTKVISTPFTYEQCLQANYIAFQNPSYSNKWFFAWIRKVTFKSPGTTQIEFEIDVWSTWWEDWTVKACFVKREHTNDDTIGKNTVPENLDIGEVEMESYDEFLSAYNNPNNYYFCINTTYDPVAEKELDGVTKINGNLSGNYVFCFDVYSGSVGVTDVTNFIYKTAQDGKINAINELYVLPKDLIDNIGTTPKNYTATTGSFESKLLNDSDSAVTLASPFNKTHSFSNYTPRNNKVFCYPYNYLLLSNNCGNINIYKYENFEQANPMFEIEMCVSVGGSIRIVPRGYKKIDYNYDESLPLAKFPTCSWSCDAFTNWLTQNAVNVVTDIVGGIAGIVAGASAGGSVSSLALSGAGTSAGIIGQFRQAILQPNIKGGNNTGDVNFSVRKNSFMLYHMRAKIEYLKIIDDYFYRYGYAVNRVYVPNIRGRQNFNYVEIGSSEEIGTGNVPVEFMETINSACRRGVTIWHNHENMGNFSVSNNIVQ